MWQRHHVAGDLQPRWYVPNAGRQEEKDQAPNHRAATQTALQSSSLKTKIGQTSPLDQTLNCPEKPDDGHPLRRH
jgi:hypothetical protein